ncbi:hypothetical protein GWK47_016460 [Chionoecetes opilio]|uniref:Uncharacterized protein n=1 Tax=Chionoecetes opilio TaxID=41210 RepID=A0A8J4XRW0_CHIOP|nr:hypothetical protein GWK47_016460 [Chionoecetes opilio]
MSSGWVDPPRWYWGIIWGVGICPPNLPGVPAPLRSPQPSTPEGNWVLGKRAHAPPLPFTTVVLFWAWSMVSGEPLGCFETTQFSPLTLIGVNCWGQALHVPDIPRGHLASSGGPSEEPWHKTFSVSTYKGKSFLCVPSKIRPQKFPAPGWYPSNGMFDSWSHSRLLPQKPFIIAWCFPKPLGEHPPHLGPCESTDLGGVSGFVGVRPSGKSSQCQTMACLLLFAGFPACASSSPQMSSKQPSQHGDLQKSSTGLRHVCAGPCH